MALEQTPEEQEQAPPTGEPEPSEAPEPAGEIPAVSAAEIETEAPSPRIHPAARRTESPEVPGEGIAAEYFIGTWSGKPLYGCPYCPWSIVSTTADGSDGSGATELHILSKIDSGDLRHRPALEVR